MATSTEQLLVRIDATTEQLRREMRQADQTVGRTTSRMDRALNRVNGAFNRMNRAVRGVGGALATLGVAMSAGAFMRGADQALTRIQEIERTALALGTTTDTVQELNYAFRQFNLRQDDVNDALSTLSDRAQDAIDGTESMQEDFALLGLTVDDLRGKSPGELFNTMAEAVANIEDPTRRSAAIVRTFGDDLGRRLAPLLMEGAQGLRNYRREAHELNAVLGYDTVQAGSDAARELNKVRSIFDAQFSRAIADSAGYFDDLAGVLASEEFQTGLETTAAAFGTLAEQIGRSVGQLGNLSNLLQGEVDLDSIWSATPYGMGADIAGRIVNSFRGGDEETGGNRSGRRQPGPQRSPRTIANRPEFAHVDLTEESSTNIWHTQTALQNLVEEEKRAQEEMRQLDRMTDSLSMTFSSAFEDAIVQGENLRGVLQGLAEDVQRIILRQTVTEPLGNWLASGISSFASGFGGGGGGTTVGNATPRSFAGGGYTGDSPRVGGMDGKGGFPAMLHPRETVVDHTKGGMGSVNITWNVDARGADPGTEQRIKQAMRETEQRTIQRVRSIQQRRGSSRV